MEYCSTAKLTLHYIHTHPNAVIRYNHSLGHKIAYKHILIHRVSSVSNMVHVWGGRLGRVKSYSDCILILTHRLHR